MGSDDDVIITPAPCLQTRSKSQGKPLKKPGAYDTGAYYAEKDAGFGDVGVDQVREGK